MATVVYSMHAPAPRTAANRRQPTRLHGAQGCAGRRRAKHGRARALRRAVPRKPVTILAPRSSVAATVSPAAHTALPAYPAGAIRY
eukprot:scaffold207_cov409-Prasinococcus_capsulatus_cf.AAC.140